MLCSRLRGRLPSPHVKDQSLVAVTFHMYASVYTQDVSRQGVVIYDPTVEIWSGAQGQPTLHGKGVG